ncbi:MAG: hypothetical protein JWL97_2076, partial [Gemmatimonadales bacterium]|nr:hypothetical protein [Gemmatimonadales bacterium]
MCSCFNHRRFLPGRVSDECEQRYYFRMNFRNTLFVSLVCGGGVMAGCVLRAQTVQSPVATGLLDEL